MLTAVILLVALLGVLAAALCNAAAEGDRRALEDARESLAAQNGFKAIAEPFDDLTWEWPS